MATSAQSRGHVLITGASTGIGRASALSLARAGFSVWAGVRTDIDAQLLEAVSDETPAGIHPLLLDVTDSSALQAAKLLIQDGVGDEGLCGLVNNAGICVVAPIECATLDDWRRQFETNLFGAIAVTQAMLPFLRVFARTHRKGARIINIGSISGELATPIFGPYGASKFALRAANDALRLELRPDNIHVSLIVPGCIQSEIWRKERALVQKLLDDPRTHQLYGTMIQKVSSVVFQRAENAIPADRVASTILRCFTAARPALEYRVGWEAHLGWHAKRWLPGWLLDLLLRRHMGITGAQPILEPQAPDLEPAQSVV